MTMTEEVVMKRLLLMMMEWMFVTLIMMMILFTCFRVAFTSSGFMPALMHLSYLKRLNRVFCF